MVLSEPTARSVVPQEAGVELRDLGHHRLKDIADPARLYDVVGAGLPAVFPPLPVVIPCHRVTASGGLGGFSNHDDENGFHLSVKRWLLRHEGATAAPWQQQPIWP